MTLRIRFIEPRPAGHHVYDQILLPRLGVPLMATMLAESGRDVAGYAEVLGPIDVADCMSADLIGISGTTSTQPSAYKLADEFEAAGIPVVLGGPHVTFCPEEALAHASYVVRGEGEQTIMELVDALEYSLPLDGIKGLSWREPSGRTHHNPARPACNQEGFERLPIPDLTLLNNYDRMTVKPIMTQWGCPYDCEFCSVTAMFSRSVRHRRNDQVIAELQGLNANAVFFHDDNFIVNKQRTGALLSEMIAKDLTPNWWAQVRADSVFVSKAHKEPDHQFLSLMSKAGCQMVMIGFESISDEALSQVGKKITVADSRAAVNYYHEHGIGVHGMFVVGLDTDTSEAPARTVDFAKEIGIDTIQLMIVTPIPGTHLWKRAVEEDRLLDADWSLFDGHHVVMKPKQMSPLELQLNTLAAMKRFYSWGSIIEPVVDKFMRSLPTVVSATLRTHSPVKLPTLARLAVEKRWHDMAKSLQAALPDSRWLDLKAGVILATMRHYGHERIGQWHHQDTSRAWLDHLKLLPLS
ncbi:MAG: B12-binding domain-containing radical SAM protein [Actinobacteria bacterium]|nr:B12-binding domain-containing radical SAM protein [Actinomycetota bacterium]MCL6094321.1 B12-binding domain-containing radical SAM protein [Actinomycetota bacterium]